MIAASLTGSMEFYVAAVFVAAAVICLASRPARKGPARTFLYAGEPGFGGTPSEARLTARVDESGRLEIYRYGLEGVSADGAYSLAVEIRGFDVTINERLTPGSGTGCADMAKATLDCFGQERYHILYRSEATGRSAAFSLRIAPGNRIDRLLT